MKTKFLIGSLLIFFVGCATFIDKKLSDGNQNISFYGTQKALAFDIQIESVGPDKLNTLSITDEIRMAIRSGQGCSVLSQSIREADNLEKENSILNNPNKAKKICALSKLLMTKGQFQLLDKAKFPEKNSMFLNIRVKENTQDSKIQKTWAYLNIFTLTLVPYREVTSIEMSVEVAKGNHQIKKYETKNTSTLWVHLLLLPYMPFSDNTHAAHENILLSILADMKKDKILE